VCEGNLTDVIMYEYKQQSHISKRRSVTSLKQETYKSYYLPTHVVQWNEKILWLKQSTDFESTQNKNIISKTPEPIYVDTV
jgi:predicted nucleic acid-binding protein